MIESDLCFNIGSKISVNYKQYIVRGSIVFMDVSSKSTWTEYKLQGCENREIRWLSIDLEYHEYALYEQFRYNRDFEEHNIHAAGYHEVDYGTARVSQFKGDVDVDSGDIVRYKEYEDSSEDNIIAIEYWEDEIEYSKGRYVEAYDIRKEYSPGSAFNVRDNDNYFDDRKKALGVAALVAGLIIIALIVSTVSNSSKKTLINKFLASSSSFAHSTSITADLDNKQKADVYSTSLSIEEAAKAIIDGIKGEVAEVQENVEDASVAILTDYEYCFIYTGEDNSTFIQVSSRQYVYSSRTALYRSHGRSFSFYRAYYYSTAYSRDKATFKGYNDAYGDYTGSSINIDANNKYKSYSNTVRQSSISSRTTSGGGTSYGK